MLARMTLLWLGLLTATAAAETVPACWAPGDLVHRQGEERVQRGVAQARITAPKRTLAEYSPVAARGAIRRVQLPPGKKLVALTFDLCEQPSEISGYQGGIVDFLRTKGDQGYILHWRQVDALPPRAHPAAHGRPHV
jgi:peptidoglycan-N-acetylglucosamine deacetylase